MNLDRTTLEASTSRHSLVVPVWHVLVREPGAPERRCVVRGPSMRVGTHEGNDLVLRDRTVSRLHAELVPESRGVRVRDLGSRNGTTIAGVTVKEGVAAAGMTVSFGATALEVSTLEHETTQVGEARFGSLHGDSAKMRELFATLARVAPSDATLLVEAESGCGKELLSRSVHENSRRREGPWVVFDCGAVAPSLIESTLFGHEKGAFTGATDAREGLIEQADGGTLFIDEVGELPLELQPRLLRFLESREVRRVGGSAPSAVDVRVIAATNRDLLSCVADRTFREDLYYRLAVVRLRIPPLRERLDDLEPLLRLLLTQAADGADQAAATLEAMTPEAWAQLRAHPWKGNVRELRNVVERSVALSPGAPVTVSLEPRLAPEGPERSAAPVDLQGPWAAQRDRLVDGFNREYFAGLLAAHEGNFSRAAAVAGIDRMYLKRLLKRYGLL